MSDRQSSKTSTGLDALVGIEYLDDGPDRATARLAVTDAVRQPHGFVHGGTYAVIAESVCSRSTGIAIRDEGMIALGQSNHATFLRPISEGHVHAVATPRHRGRTTWIWDCELSDDEGRLCSLVRMTVAVRPAPDQDE